MWLIAVFVLQMNALHCFAQETKPPQLLIAGISTAVLLENDRVVRTFPTRGTSQDAWLLETGEVLLSELKGVTKFDAEGTVVMRYTSPEGKHEIHSCQPLPDGGVLVAESGPPRLLELDAAGNVVKAIAVEDIKFDNPHVQMRAARKNQKGEYGIIAAGEMNLVLLNADGSTKKVVNLQKLPASIKHKYSHGLAYLDNGHILVSTSYGSCFVELDATGRMVWSLTPEDVPELQLTYAAGMQRLPNGNTVCTAYNSPYPIFEVTPDKKIVWKIKARPEIGHPTHVQVLTDRGQASRFELQR